MAIALNGLLPRRYLIRLASKIAPVNGEVNVLGKALYSLPA